MEQKTLRTYQTMSLSMPPRLLKQVLSLARQEGKTKSELMREALRQYIEMKEMRKAQSIFSKRARELGIKDEDDIERIVEEYRSEQAKTKH
jgi:CopG family transcriptional regulator/antitoxin EndoAI